MALEYWWIFAIALAIIISLSAITFFVSKNRSAKHNKTVYLANTRRLVLSPEYVKLFKKYTTGLVTIIALLGVAVTSLALVAGKPVLYGEAEPVKHNRDIVLCLDVSGSMTAVDKEIIATFKKLSQEFAGERISLVVFNSISNQVFPLTDDYNYMTEQFDKVIAGLGNDADAYDLVSYTIRGDGASLVGDGLTSCIQSFEDESDTKRSRSVILATDNMLNGEEIITLPESVDIAIREKVKVYGINPETIENAVDSESMKQEIIRSGGEYYPLSSPSLVPSIVDKISAEQAAETKGKKIVTVTDIPQLPIGIAFVAILGAIVTARRFQV